MEYPRFFELFGAASRTKNILSEEDASLKASGVRQANLRRFILPPGALLPKEFIRLCPWEMEYVFTVARRARFGILEVGRFNGGSLFVMAAAARPGIPIHSIDIDPQDDEFLWDVLDKHCPDANINIIVGDSQHTTYPEIGKVDLLFIDGDHTYEGCLADVENWYGHLKNNGHLLFHDSYLVPHGVQDAIADFMDRHPELQVIQSPFIGPAYWNYPAGSIAHFIKRPRQHRNYPEGRGGRAENSAPVRPRVLAIR